MEAKLSLRPRWCHASTSCRRVGASNAFRLKAWRHRTQIVCCNAPTNGDSRKAHNALAATLMATCLAWNAGHAVAVTSVTGEQSQRYREELEQLIKARMKPGERALPELRSSPAVQELRSKLVKAESAIAPGGNARSAADAAELEQLRRKLDEALRNEERLKQQLLEESKRQAPETVTPVPQAPSQPVAPIPAPAPAQQASSTAPEKPTPKPTAETTADATAPAPTRAVSSGAKEEASGFSLLVPPGPRFLPAVME